MDSQNTYLSSLLSTLIYFPTEHRWAYALSLWGFDSRASRVSLLPTHAAIPELPPRPIR